MTSLRSRLAILLVGAIVAVVVLAAVVTRQILDRPNRDSFAGSFAEEVRIVRALLASDPEAAGRLGIATGPKPAGDEDLLSEARRISRLLRQSGDPGNVLIHEAPHSDARRMAFEVRPGTWAFLPYPGAPQSVIGPLFFYLALVTAGAVAVSLFAAKRMTRPLRMLDEAIDAAGPDGLPPHLPEEGPVEVRTTAAALNRLTATLRRAVESRMRLVAAAGHDLRTPMTRMRLRAEFLPEEDRAVWLRDLEELDRIADSAIRLVREEVSGEGEEPRLDLARLLGEIGREMAEMNRPVALHPMPPLQVRARPLGLKRALRNLVENAVLHGGDADIALAAEGADAVIRIEDTGPGIPEAMMARAFEPFFRVDEGRRKSHAGAGLGLAIAKEIVDRAGGTIRLVNRPEGGLRQEVRLPLTAAG